MKCFTIPEEFDYNFYKTTCPNAKKLDKEAAYTHFISHGKKEGFAGAALAGRSIFLAFLSEYGFRSILEIGPGVNPTFKGNNVSYFDVRQGSEFHEYARQKGVTDLSTLPTIHHYSPNGCLEGINAQFELVFSSHCIEHTFDIIKHCNEVYDLLVPGGMYCLIVPDKRYTFDFFKNPTTLTDVLYRHSLDIPFHSLKAYLDVVYETHNDWLRHWHNDHGNYAVTEEIIQRQIEAFAAQKGRDPGLHAWIFTEDSFRNTFLTLHELGMIKLYPHRTFNVVRDANEFCVILTKE